MYREGEMTVIDQFKGCIIAARPAMLGHARPPIPSRG
jgi:hypothetical protein